VSALLLGFETPTFNLCSTVEAASCRDHLFNLESTLRIVYEPQAIFRVVPVTRCTASLPGHGEPVVSVQFSPDGRFVAVFQISFYNLFICRHLASGSGDCTVRLWDLSTELPQYTCTTHKAWVLTIAWSPDAQHLASADKNGQVRGEGVLNAFVEALSVLKRCWE
jgi:ribosome assembly protein 4